VSVTDTRIHAIILIIQKNSGPSPLWWRAFFYQYPRRRLTLFRQKTQGGGQFTIPTEGSRFCSRKRWRYGVYICGRIEGKCIRATSIMTGRRGKNGITAAEL
jgi:hypothetical protein